MERILKAVKWYASKGWPVIPLYGVRDGKCLCQRPDCDRQGKHPRTLNGLKDASADPARIRAWWEAWPDSNIGLVTGAGSGLVVLDEDGPEGRTSLTGLEIPATVVARTGKGRHIYFRHPGREVRNFTRKLPGVDFRGDGGYVVASPSFHASGSRYEWLRAPWETEIAPCPAWLLALFDKPAEPAPETRPGPVEAGEVIPSGQRNATMTSLAGTMRKRGMKAEEMLPALQAVNERRCVPPLSERELRQIINSVANYAEGEKPLGIPVPEGKKQDVIKLMETRLDAIKSGEYQSISWPWPMFTRVTQALLPGKIVMIIGSPGASKSFSLLQACNHWIKVGANPAVFAFEDDIEFHSQRLLAQVSGDSRFTDIEWVKDNSGEYAAALQKYTEEIRAFGEKHWYMATEEDTQDDLIVWMDRKAKEGHRVLGIDPITMAEQTAEPWIADKVFVKSALKVLKKYGASLVMVTHPQKGEQAGLGTMAGGASYGNFAPTVISIQRHEDKTSSVRRFLGYDTDLPRENVSHNSTFCLEKTRNGRGGGMKMAFQFDPWSLTFQELGVIYREPRRKKEEEEM